MVQVMNNNHVSKLAPLMAKPTHEGKVMLNINDKPQSMKEMLLVFPQQSLEEYCLGPLIYILNNPFVPWVDVCVSLAHLFPL